jgi:uncharacterized protein (TIGR00369 family)
VSDEGTGRLWDAVTPEEEERYFRIVTDRVEGSPYYKLIGMEVAGLSPGHSSLRLKAGPRIHNLGGIVHGGAIMSIADAAAGVALATLLDKERERPMTIEIKVNFCSPSIDDDLFAEGSVVRKGSRIATCESEVKTKDGRIVAKSLATYMIIDLAEEQPA